MRLMRKAGETDQPPQRRAFVTLPPDHGARFVPVAELSAEPDQVAPEVLP
jgi:hypothetical protein